MIKPYNKARAMKEKLKEAGKFLILDSSADVEAVLKMNAHMMKVRKEYQMKSKNSKRRANQVIFS
jgi:hypothetical protein